MAVHYKHFKDIPSFPRIGGTYDIKHHSPNCGECWNITNNATHKFIYLTAIDSSESLTISEEACKFLGWPLVVKVASKVCPSFCSH